MHTVELPHSSVQNDGQAVASAEIDFFRLFALCFGQPSRETFAWLSRRDSRTLWKQLGRNLGVQVKFTRADQFSDYSSYEAAYIALFEVGVPEPPVPLLESAHSKRAGPQQIVLECVNFYDVLGMRPSGSTFPADHLVTQLEFLAALCYHREQQPESQKVEPLRRLERDFLERHLLNWLPAAQRKIDQLTPPLFPTLLRLLTTFLKHEAGMVSKPQ